MLHTCRGSLAMTTIYSNVWHNCLGISKMWNTRACADMQSFVNIQCHPETFQALSTNFRDNPCMVIIFSHFFCFVNLVSFFFLAWNAIKVYRQWVSWGRNSFFSFPSIVLKLCSCFQHGMKLYMSFWYNPLIFFLSLQFSGTYLSFFSDSFVAGL